MIRRALAAAMATLLAALVLAPGASAHAILESASPARGATLAQAPERILLRFNEPVEGNFGALRVFDAAAKRVDDDRVEHPGGRGPALSVGLRPGLPDGTYVATYRVVSADGHPVAGGLVFSVGAPGAAPARTVDELIGDDAGPVTGVAFAAARALTYLATALLLGGLGFLGAVWRPARRELAGTEGEDEAAAAFRSRLRRVLASGAVLGALSGAAGIVLQGATAAGTSAWAALDPGVIEQVLGTRFGRVWGLRVAAFVLLAVAVVVWLRGTRRTGRLVVLAAIPAAFLAVAPALGGHASVRTPVAALLPLDIAHVLAMSAWIGGLVALVLVLPAATRRLALPDRTRLLAGALTRFSPIALGCVAVLLVTGTIQAVLHIGSWAAVLDTGFGRAVVVKAVLLGVLIGLGTVNRRRVVPALRRLAAGAQTPGAAGHLLRRMLRAEVALVVVVLGVTGALVSYPPPDSLAGGPFSGTARLGPLSLQATVDPARVGSNEMHLYLLRASDGTPFAGTKELTVSLSLPDKAIGPIPARAREAGPGHYVIDAVSLVPAGDWRVEVTSRVTEFDQHRTSLKVPVR